MSNKIVLISEDADFFDYIRTKLELRKSDELFTFAFDSIPEKLHLLKTAVLIVNSENAKEKTLDLLTMLKGSPVVIFAFNEDEIFRRKCFRAGAFDFIPLLISDTDFRARMLPLFSVSTLLEKNQQYRDVLVKNGILSDDNEIFVDYNYILDKELEDINAGAKKAVFVAISPNEKSKFLMKPSLVEAVILNNIRRNDILMNYAANKYFLLLFDLDLSSAQKLWKKIASELPNEIYAGFCQISNQKRQQLINEVLNKLHEAINHDKITNQQIISSNFSVIDNIGSNFKMFRQEFGRKIEQVVTPVFYQVQQKYSGKLSGVTLEQGSGECYGSFYIKGKQASSSFRISAPGFSKINIDITYQKDSESVDAKRISLEPEELEAGLLEDLLEQFILEYKRGCAYDS